MRRSILLAVSVTLLGNPPAFADFVIKQDAPEPQITAQDNNQLSPPQDAAQTDGSDGNQTPETPGGAPIIRWKMAYGFGDQVPLSFACRQIIPPAVKVTYGPGANPNMLVNWKGGDTWNHVLWNAVKPLGLRLVMTRMAVEIRK